MAILLAGLVLAWASGPAFAGGLGSGCNLVSSGLDNVAAEPLETVFFQFTIEEDTPGSCSLAEGDILLDAPQGSATLVSAATWSGSFGDTIDVEVETTSSTGTATIEANCSLCSGSPLQFTLTTTPASDWTLDLVTPADGDSVTGGQTLTLTIAASDNGMPVTSGEFMRWEFVGNTNGSSFVGTPTPGAPLDNNPTQPSGQNSVDLVVGAPNAGLQPITISATIGYDSPATQETLTFTLFASDIVTVDSNNAAADGQSGEPGTPVPVAYSVVVHRNGTADALAGPVEWTVSPAGAVVFDTPETPTDSGGVATTTATFGPTPGPFVVIASHADYPDVTDTFDGEVLGGSNDDLGIEQPLSGSGDGQIAAPNAFLEPLQAIATEDGAPDDNISVTWSVISGDAVLTGGNPTISDSDGRVSMPVTLGPTEGESVIRAALTVDATVFVDYTVIALASGSPGLQQTDTDSGDGQTGPVNTTLPLPLRALATEESSPTSGVQVNWQVTSGTATLGSPTTVSDVNGIVEVSVTLGATPGPVTITASRDDFPSINATYTVTATGVAPVLALGKPATQSGDNQTGSVGTPVPLPLKALATNDGAPVSGVSVTWAVESGSATLAQPASVTDATGIAGVSVTFGPTPGPVVIRATRADAPSASTVFNLTAVPFDTPLYTLRKPSVGSGDGQDGDTGEPLAQSLVVVAENDGTPAPGVTVQWSIGSGDATLDGPTSITNIGGRASMGLTFGDTPGTVTVTATRADAPLATSTFVLTSSVAEPDLLTIEKPAESGDDATAAAGETITLTARTLRNGTASPFLRVVWERVSGDGVLRPTVSTSANGGLATTRLTVGTATGPIEVRAYLVDDPSASTTYTINADGEPGGSDTIAIVSGNNQIGPIQTAADQPLVVQVRDASGAPAADRNVQWERVTGSATLGATSTVTDSDGRSSIGLTFGNSAGPVEVLAYLSGDREHGVRFTLDAAAPTIFVVDGGGQSGAPGETLAEDFVVGIAIPQPAAKASAGVTVTFAVIEGGGTLSVQTAVTDAQGQARTRLTLGPAPGINRVRATVATGASTEFIATAESEPAAVAIEPVSGNGQTLATQATSAPLVVVVRDSDGAPVPGATVLWSGNNADITQTTSVTDGNGRASVTARVVLPGAASVTATLDGTDASTTFGLNAGLGNIAGLTQPQEDVARAIDRFCPELASRTNLSAEQADLRARCLELVDNAGDEPGDVRDALEALRQDVAFGQSNAAYAAVNAQFDNLKTRIAAVRSGSSGMDLGGLALASATGVVPLSLLPADETDSSGGSDTGGDFSRWGFFASGTIGRGSQDGDDATPEYDFDSSGLTAGVDYRVSDQVIVGVSAGWNQQDTDLARDGGSVETTGWSLSAYSTFYRDNAFYIDGVLSFGSNDYDLQRNVRYALAAADGSTTQIDQRATATSGGDQRSLALSLGRDFQKGPWSLGPYLRGTFTQIDFDAYSERMIANLPGAGLALAVDARDLESRTAVLGGKATYAMSRDWGILMPHMQLEWEHEFQDDPDALVARFLYDPTFTAIATDGTALDTDYYNVGFGLSALFPGGRSAFLYYERLIGASGQSQDNLSLGVRIEF